jgi:hypothetical protein
MQAPRTAVPIAAVVFAALPLSGGVARGAKPPDCDLVDVEYAVSANLRIAGTVFGAGDGQYKIGPGRVLLRFDSREGAPYSGPSVEMRAFEVRQNFTVVSRAFFLSTRVTTDVDKRALPDARSIVAVGRLGERALHWESVTGTVRDDGFLDCNGAFCGEFGAPPPGRSELHMGPSKINFAPFEFGADMKTFSMGSILASKTNAPHQETYMAISGREIGRTCVVDDRR